MIHLGTIDYAPGEGPSSKNSVLDPTPEKVFDDLAWMATQICKAPIAVVSVSSSNGQRVKAKVGLTTEEAASEFTICAEVLVQRRLHVMNDVIQNERFVSNSWVVGGPKLRFFVGLPLITSDGTPVGVLSVMDRVPRQLGPEQLYGLDVLARQLITQLEARQRTNKVR